MNMDQLNQKRVRVQTEADSDRIDLNASDVIKFYFDDCQEGVPPGFVHQNFEINGVLSCPKNQVPLSIDVHVNSKDLSANLAFSHSGSADDIGFRVFVSDVISRLTTACDLGNGCKPATYPGGFALTPTLDAMTPSETFQLTDGYYVERYQSSLFNGSSLNLWKRAEWLMLWSIESVTQSDHENDENWEYYFLRDTSGCINAMCSVYKFPSFALLSENKTLGERMRLSQFLTVPSKWNKGTGSRLLRFLAEYVIGRPDVDMLSMEDPSFGMTSMRESVYLAIAKNDHLMNEESIDVIGHRLKVPHSFAKRILSLLEIEKLRKGRKVSASLVNEIIHSGNKFVNNFIDKIEFYDDEETDEPVPLSEDKSVKLINESIQGALLKLEKVMSSGA